MTIVIHGDTGPHAYLNLVRTVIKEGVKRAPRNEQTRDLGLTVVEILGPTRAYPVGVGRGLNRRIVAAEAVQLVGAFSDPDLLGPSFEPYKEADGRFWGAYGDRIRTQLVDVVRKLRHDHNTRQAVISLWDPQLDNVPFKHDYPCTLVLTFSVDYAGRLDLDVVMRSQDVWLGSPYDWGQFSVMLMTVATLLDREVGTYRHTTLSTHIYERNVAEALTKLHAQPEEVGVDAFPPGFARKADTAFGLIRRLRRLPYDSGSYVNSEHWYRDALGASSGAFIRPGDRGSCLD